MLLIDKRLIFGQNDAMDTITKRYVTAKELLEAGLPKAILWNNDPDRKMPADIFIIATLKRAYNDFVVKKLAEFFGAEYVITALNNHKDQVSDRLYNRVTSYLKGYTLYDTSQNRSAS